MKNLYYDVVIAGCGVAGLYAALNLPEEMNILMLSKKDLESCDSMLAQGGICVLRDESDTIRTLKIPCGPDIMKIERRALIL